MSSYSARTYLSKELGAVTISFRQTEAGKHNLGEYIVCGDLRTWSRAPPVTTLFNANIKLHYLHQKSKLI